MERLDELGLSPEEINSIECLVLEGKIRVKAFKSFGNDLRLAGALHKNGERR